MENEKLVDVSALRHVLIDHFDGSGVAAGNLMEKINHYACRRIPTVDKKRLIVIIHDELNEVTFCNGDHAARRVFDALSPYLTTQAAESVESGAESGIEPIASAEQPVGKSFDEWSASVKDCGHDVQPLSATARQRRLGWDAAMASMNKRESGEPYLHNFADGAIGHYCIARQNPKGYAEYWNDGEWTSAGEVFCLGNQIEGGVK